MITFLVWTVIILGIIAVSRLVRIYELASSLRGGQPQWEVTEKDNRSNALMMIIFAASFFAFSIWLFFEYKDRLLPIAASKHGAEIDWLFNFNMVIIGIVFFITNSCLFYFSYKYYAGKNNQKATFFPESHKLELIWTVVPGVALTIIIFLGIKLWNDITSVPGDEIDKVVIELYAKQFDWTARYAGKDNELGRRNFKLITDTNPMGLDITDKKGDDDIVVRNEFHIPKGKLVYFKMGSRDVIHSAYMPHFRAQMNCVPGMTTMFHYIPTVTTAEMRRNPQVVKNMEEVNAILSKKGEEPMEFNYLLLCNKICGVSHYNMQMNIIVDEPAEYEAWLQKQKTVGSIASNEVKTETSKIVAQNK